MIAKGTRPNECIRTIANRHHHLLDGVVEMSARKPPHALRPSNPAGPCEPRILRVDRIALICEPWEWPFTSRCRGAIGAYFRREKRANSSLRNGRLLLVRDLHVGDGALRGRCFETDYASLLAGLARSDIGHHVKACLGVAALMGSDGAFIVGRMGPHTRNAGQIYFPSGSFDRKDVIAGKLDVLGSIWRELREETGLVPDGLVADPDWHVVFAGPRVPLFKVVRASEPADVVRSRMVANLASQKRPEFVAIEVVCSHQLDPRMPPWMQSYLRHAWAVLLVQTEFAAEYRAEMP